MFSFLSSIIQFFMYWVFMYVGAFLLMIVGIVWIIKTNPTLPTPIINEYYSTVTHQVIEPPKRVLVEREICKSIKGCKEVNGTCPTCVIEKVWE